MRNLFSPSLLPIARLNSGRLAAKMLELYFLLHLMWHSLLDSYPCCRDEKVKFKMRKSYITSKAKLDILRVNSTYVVTLTFLRWQFILASTPTIVPWIAVPFLSSIVTVSRLSFCRNLTSFMFVFWTGYGRWALFACEFWLMNVVKLF